MSPAIALCFLSAFCLSSVAADPWFPGWGWPSDSPPPTVETPPASSPPPLFPSPTNPSPYYDAPPYDYSPPFHPSPPYDNSPPEESTPPFDSPPYTGSSPPSTGTTPPFDSPPYAGSSPPATGTTPPFGSPYVGSSPPDGNTPPYVASPDGSPYYGGSSPEYPPSYGPGSSPGFSFLEVSMSTDWSVRTDRWPVPWTPDSSVVDAFGDRAGQVYGQLAFIDGLLSQGEDGYSNLLKEGVTALLNSCDLNFLYTGDDVKRSFMEALNSEAAATVQALKFHNANSNYGGIV